MRTGLLLAAAGLALGVASVANGQVVAGTVPVAISDTTNSTSTATVAGVGVITDVNVIFQCTHTWDSDIDLILSNAGDAKYLILSSDNGSSGDNYSTTRFDDLAAASITTGVAPMNDNFKPEGSGGTYSGTLPAGASLANLGGFNGDVADGTWTLRWYDDAGGDTGSVTYWSIEFNGAVDPAGPPPITAPTNPSGTGLATPASGLVASTTLLTVVVSPGGNPVSTGLGVVADLTGIGGSATQTFYDDGTNGDVTIGDNTFSFSATVGAVAGGAKTMPFTITDAQLRSGTGNIAFYVAAEPGVFEDLGSIACTPTDRSATLAANEVKWYKVTLPATGVGTYVDMWTVSTGTIGDTEMGLFDSSGALIASDDDSGNGLKSELSFGDVGPRANPDGGTAAALTGQNGALAGGVYWLATGSYSMTFANGWQVTSGATVGTVDVHINAIDIATCNTPPSGAGTATPAGVTQGQSTLLVVDTTPGANPASTGITVTGDTSGFVGGNATQTFYDDGTNGDAVSGDGNYSFLLAVDCTEPTGAHSVAFTVADAQARSGTGNIAVTVNAAAVFAASGVSGNGQICGNSLLRVTVTPAACPPSTGIAVTADLTTIGGGAADAMYDDGTNGDVTSGDNTFSLSVLTPAGAEGTVFTLPFSASDAAAHTASGNMTLTLDRAGDTCATAYKKGNAAASILGSLGTSDIDMFAICVGDPLTFGATTYPGTLYDTQLFLFNPDCTGALMNDDVPTGNPGDTTLQSAIVGVPLAAGGLYYLAVSRYDNDPQDAASADLWLDTPFDVVRAPDGAGAANALHHWSGSASTAGAYQVDLTSATTTCAADMDDGSGTGTPDCGVDFNDLLFFLAEYEGGLLSADVDDGSFTGTPDCGVDFNDLLYFLSHYEAGC